MRRNKKSRATSSRGSPGCHWYDKNITLWERMCFDNFFAFQVRSYRHTWKSRANHFLRYTDVSKLSNVVVIVVVDVVVVDSHIFYDTQM